MDRIVLLSSANALVVDELRRIADDCTFLYAKEHALQNVLLEAYSEMAFVVRQFQASHDHLLNHGTPELSDYIRQINAVDARGRSEFVVELHVAELSTFFKSFLLLAKAVLDKVVPLYSYRFYDNLKQFSDKGTRLIRLIRNNKHVGKKAEMVALIEEAKRNWIDGLIDLRDQYAHYSSLPEYTNFWLSGDLAGRRALAGIEDFNRPTIVVAGQALDALQYVLTVKMQLVEFLREFLLSCEFTAGRRPRRYLNCECGYVFAKRSKSGANKGRLSLTGPKLDVRVRDRALDYGVIVCPACGGETDTDLEFWRQEGFSFFDPKPATA
jgi:hypothetical protein